MNVIYNRETGEVFTSREAALLDAAEQYDFGDPTNAMTYMGFPNEELPYIEIDDKALGELFRVFG